MWLTTLWNLYHFTTQIIICNNVVQFYIYMDKIIDKRTVWTRCLLHYTTIIIYHWLPMWCIILFCWCISCDIQLFVHVLICLLNQKHSKIGKHRIVCNICTVLETPDTQSICSYIDMVIALPGFVHLARPWLVERHRDIYRLRFFCLLFYCTYHSVLHSFTVIAEY